MEATRIGDEILVDSVGVGQSPRRGEILDVRGEPGHEHYVVRWEDRHESVFFPASTAHLVHKTPESGRGGQA